MSKRPIDEAVEPHASAKQAKPSMDAASLTMWIEAWVKTNVCSKLNLAGLEITTFLDEVSSNMTELLDFEEFLQELTTDNRIHVSNPTPLHDKMISAVSDYVHGHVLSEFMSNVFRTRILNKNAATEFCDSIDNDGVIDKLQFNVLYTVAEEILSGGAEVEEDSEDSEPPDESDPEEDSEEEESESSGSDEGESEDSEESEESEGM